MTKSKPASASAQQRATRTAHWLRGVGQTTIQKILEAEIAGAIAAPATAAPRVRCRMHAIARCVAATQCQPSSAAARRAR